MRLRSGGGLVFGNECQVAACAWVEMGMGRAASCVRRSRGVFWGLVRCWGCIASELWCVL